MSATEILARLVAFDTTSRNSNLPLIEWVEAYLDQFDVGYERVYDPTGTKACLWATIGPKDVAGYVLSGHTDVVPVDDQVWATDPFTLTEVGSRLYGRGTSDMKGFAAVCLSRLPAMVEKVEVAQPAAFAEQDAAADEMAVIFREKLVVEGVAAAVVVRQIFIVRHHMPGIRAQHGGKAMIRRRVHAADGQEIHHIGLADARRHHRIEAGRPERKQLGAGRVAQRRERRQRIGPARRLERCLDQGLARFQIPPRIHLHRLGKWRALSNFRCVWMSPEWRRIPH